MHIEYELTNAFYIHTLVLSVVLIMIVFFLNGLHNGSEFVEKQIVLKQEYPKYVMAQQLFFWALQTYDLFWDIKIILFDYFPFPTFYYFAIWGLVAGPAVYCVTATDNETGIKIKRESLNGPQKPSYKDQFVFFLIRFFGMPVEIANKVFFTRFNTQLQELENARRFLMISFTEEFPMVLVLTANLFTIGGNLRLSDFVKIAFSFFFLATNMSKNKDGWKFYLVGMFSMLVAVLGFNIMFFFQWEQLALDREGFRIVEKATTKGIAELYTYIILVVTILGLALERKWAIPKLYNWIRGSWVGCLCCCCKKEMATSLETR